MNKNQADVTQDVPQIESFEDFYPYYLSEHQHPICRALHYIGSSLAILLSAYILMTGTWALLPAVLIVGYGCAWVGHFFFEHNKPATFHYPKWSFLGDWVMLKDFLTGQLKNKLPK